MSAPLRILGAVALATLVGNSAIRVSAQSSPTPSAKLPIQSFRIDSVEADLVDPTTGSFRPPQDVTVTARLSWSVTVATSITVERADRTSPAAPLSSFSALASMVAQPDSVNHFEDGRPFVDKPFQWCYRLITGNFSTPVLCTVLEQPPSDGGGAISVTPVPPATGTAATGMATERRRINGSNVAGLGAVLGLSGAAAAVVIRPRLRRGGLREPRWWRLRF